MIVYNQNFHALPFKRTPVPPANSPPGSQSRQPARGYLRHAPLIQGGWLLPLQPRSLVIV
jgi:hypothetical protein